MQLLYHDQNIVPAIPAITRARGTQYTIHTGALPVRGRVTAGVIVSPAAVVVELVMVVGVAVTPLPAVTTGVEVAVRTGVAVG